MSRQRFSGKFSKTTKYLIRLGIVLVIIMEAMISFLNDSLHGLKMQKQKLDLTPSNTAFAAMAIYLILPRRPSSSLRIRKPLILLSRRLAQSLNRTQILIRIKLRNFQLKELKKGKLVNILIKQLALQERCIILSRIFKALTPTITTLLLLPYEQSLQIIRRVRTRSIR